MCGIIGFASNKKIANKMNQFDGIINSKLPESDKDGEKNPMSGLTCKEAYNKQLNDIKENYEKYLKEKTGKTIEEYHTEGKFDPEQVIQVGYFPIYYFLKPLFNSMMELITNQELIIMKFTEKMNQVNTFFNQFIKEIEQFENNVEEFTEDNDVEEEQPTKEQEEPEQEPQQTNEDE